MATEKERTIDLAARVKRYNTNDSYIQKQLANALTLSYRHEPVLITGSTGTGKELIAHILHGTRVGEFVTVNTTAVTDTLFESELFGHLKGSYTGAFRDRDGLVEYAKNGTLFLDEIGDMPLGLQAKLLRFIQFGTYRRVGDNETRISNCRIVAATCASLPLRIKMQEFREDLYYRLSTFNIHLTSLMQRVGDAVLYIENHPAYEKMSKKEIQSLMKHLSVDKLAGNYRELEQLMLRYEVLKELPENVKRY
jgi:transcriptional regulator with PAS, ATPase and Fis domain